MPETEQTAKVGTCSVSQEVNLHLSSESITSLCVVRKKTNFKVKHVTLLLCVYGCLKWLYYG